MTIIPITAPRRSAMQLTKNSIITIETGNMTFEGRVLRDIDSVTP